MRVAIVFLALVCFLPLLAMETMYPLSPAETSQLVEMLGVAGFDSLSLNFEKDWDLSAKYKLDWQLSQLQEPWRAFDGLAQLRKVCPVSDSLPESLPILLQNLGGIAFNLEPALFNGLFAEDRARLTESFRARVRKPKDIFNWFTDSLHPVSVTLSEALASFDQAAADSLLAWWMWQFIESEDAEAYRGFYEERGLPGAAALDGKSLQLRLGDLDGARLLEAGIEYLALCEVLRAEAPNLQYRNRRPLSKKTGWGTLVIGTTGDDIYTRESFPRGPLCLLLEPGGNDRYELDLRTGLDNSFYLLLDLGGNDHYRNYSPGGMFRSSFGLGYSWDASGDDVYDTGDFSFSAFMGMGLHRDGAGDDIYRSGLFAQGAAMCGVALLLEDGGNDLYQASASSQGIGSTRGVGAILDQGGHDNYALGGKYFHEPLMPLDFITLGQGMGLGLRPDLAGGLGLLYDRGGNDRYLGGVYAQGSGYWYAVGALIDEAGNDVYNTVYYPQGSGIHLANGYLFDGEGDDTYYSRNGPGQGAAHDWGLGVFIEGGGNDAYSIPGGHGLALTNSVAVFVDKSGDDRYERREVQNLGSANFARGTGGLGLFLDAGGKDSYPDTLQTNNKTWQQGTYGIGRDLELNLVAKSAVETLAQSAALPDSTADIAEIFAAASEWEVGSAVQRVRKAREIMLARAAEAIPYVLREKMSTDSGLEYRALEALAKGSPDFVRGLYPLIEGADSLAAKNAMSLVAGVGDSLLVEYVERLLEQGKYRTACLSVLSGVQTLRSVNLLRAYLRHPSERYRYIVARSLSQIKLPEARAALREMEDDRSFLVQALLRNLPAEASP